jgi:tetratricopeptide (TPR) repeat protein
MPDDIRQLSAQLAQDPGSLVFLRLGELLRRKGQVDTAQRVAITGLERHPHNADAHDLYARILADKHDFERAFDEWDMALRIAPNHTGALKGLAFLYFKIGDIAQAIAHLEEAKRVAPDDPSVEQALALVQGAAEPGPPPPEPEPAPKAATLRPPPPPRPPAPPKDESVEAPPQPAPAPPAPAPRESVAMPEPAPLAVPGAGAPLERERVFAGLEGAQEGLLLLDGSGRVMGGAVRHPNGSDATDAVAAYLAGVSQEATRTGKLLTLGKWTGLSAEGQAGHVHLAQLRQDALLLVVRDRSVPLGRLAVLAERAAQHARSWLEAQG